MNDLIALSLVFLFIIIFIRGFVIVFYEHFWLAALMAICFFPLLFLWALVEGLFNWR